MAVCFADIVGYTSQSKNLTETELVDLVELFEDETTRLVVAAGGRVIKTIGDEVLFVADDAGRRRSRWRWTLTARGRGRRGRVPPGPGRAGLRVGDAAGSATSSGRPSTSPPGSRRSRGPGRCWSTAARSTR